MSHFRCMGTLKCQCLLRQVVKVQRTGPGWVAKHSDKTVHEKLQWRALGWIPKEPFTNSQVYKGNPYWRHRMKTRDRGRYEMTFQWLMSLFQRFYSTLLLWPFHLHPQVSWLQRKKSHSATSLSWKEEINIKDKIKYMAAVIQEIFLVGYHSPFGFNFLATNVYY
jgi:hypothetical protein